MAGKAGEEMSKALGAANNATRNGIKTTEDQIAFEAKIKAESKAQKESEAKAAVETQKAIQELGQAVMAALMPAIKLLTPMMNGLVHLFGGIIKVMTEYKTITIALAAAAAAYLVTQKTMQVLNAVKAAKAGGGRGPLGGLGVMGALAGGKAGGPLGSSPDNAMWVRIAGGGSGGLGEALAEHGKGGKEPGKTGGGKASMAKNLLKGGAGVLGGLALGYVGDKLKENDHEKLGAGADIAGGALTGASTGAMIGSLAGPLGTAIGGALGGVIGGGMSLYDNWGTLTGKGKEVPKHAEGGIATKPSVGMIGEAGPEAILPLSRLKDMLGSMTPASALGSAMSAANSMMGSGIGGNKGVESLSKEIETLNKNTIEMIRHLKDIANHTEQGASATKSLGGDLFKF
jgi:hypothetical protein